MLTSRMLLSGRYELDERIGAGGNSEVWRAADLTLARLVAVKLLYAGFAQHADAVARFRAEARHAGRLSQENIARVYDYAEADGSYPPFLVMELVDGPSLASVLLEGPLEAAPAAAVIAQAAAGLEAAHQAGLIHRDIKPGNLLVTAGGTIKVADFGISHAVGAEPMTGTGLLLGTPGYLAPERVAGGPATPASDLYALGIVAWECLAGQPPFTGSALDIALAHRDRVLPPLPAGTPPGLAGLVAELTARDPRDRPASAALVAGRACELAGGVPAAIRSEGRLAAARAGRDRLAAGSVPRPATATPGAATSARAALAGRTPGGAASAAAAGRMPAGAASAAASGQLSLPVTDRLAWPAEVGTAPARPRGRRLRSRRALLGATTLVAAVAGLVTASQVGPLTPAHVAAQPSGRSLPRASGTQLITVSADALTGHSVAAVAARLRREGLRVRVRWQVTPDRPPGTVLSISPSGFRPAGSLVTVMGAHAPAVTARVAVAGAGPKTGRAKAHGHGNGNGNGNGGGKGNGGGNGKGKGKGNGNGSDGGGSGSGNDGGGN